MITTQVQRDMEADMVRRCLHHLKTQQLAQDTAQQLPMSMIHTSMMPMERLTNQLHTAPDMKLTGAVMALALQLVMAKRSLRHAEDSPTIVRGHTESVVAVLPPCLCHGDRPSVLSIARRRTAS
jgi:hypothetical protein